MIKRLWAHQRREWRRSKATQLRRWANKRRTIGVRCPRCGYDVRGLVDIPCPECGLIQRSAWFTGWPMPRTRLREVAVDAHWLFILFGMHPAMATVGMAWLFWLLTPPVGVIASLEYLRVGAFLALSGSMLASVLISAACVLRYRRWIRYGPPILARAVFATVLALFGYLIAIFVLANLLLPSSSP